MKKIPLIKYNNVSNDTWRRCAYFFIISFPPTLVPIIILFIYLLLLLFFFTVQNTCFAIIIHATCPRRVYRRKRLLTLGGRRLAVAPRSWIKLRTAVAAAVESFAGGKTRGRRRGATERGSEVIVPPPSHPHPPTHPPPPSHPPLLLPRPRGDARGGAAESPIVRARLGGRPRGCGGGGGGGPGRGYVGRSPEGWHNSRAAAGRAAAIIDTRGDGEGRGTGH